MKLRKTNRRDHKAFGDIKQNGLRGTRAKKAESFTVIGPGQPLTSETESKGLKSNSKPKLTGERYVGAAVLAMLST